MMAVFAEWFCEKQWVDLEGEWLMGDEGGARKKFVEEEMVQSRWEGSVSVCKALLARRRCSSTKTPGHRILTHLPSPPSGTLHLMTAKQLFLFMM